MCINVYMIYVLYIHIVILFLEMYTLSWFTRGVSHLKPKHFPSAHGTGRATNAEYSWKEPQKVLTNALMTSSRIKTTVKWENPEVYLIYYIYIHI